jgi:hypothetical protein
MGSFATNQDLDPVHLGQPRPAAGVGVRNAADLQVQLMTALGSARDLSGTLAAESLVGAQRLRERP